MPESTSPCFHCGEPVPTGAQYAIRYRQHDEAACCAGCQAVAQTIIDSGLGDYYDQRQARAGKADALPDELLAQLKLYDAPEVQQSFVRVEPDQVREAALILEGITCAACIWLNERHLAQLPGVLAASINYSSHRARVRWDNSRVQLSDILAAVAAIGYRAHPFDPDRQEALYAQERKTALNRLWIAGLSMMQVMMYAVPAYLAAAGEIETRFELLLRWASLALTLPVVLYSCWPFYVATWRDLQRGRLGMDAPVSLGVLSAFLASVWATLHGGGAVYFDSVSMFVFLLLAGRYLEMLARRKAGAAAEQLVKLIPAFAWKLADYPQASPPQAVSVASLQLGDVLLVKPGETIACDGEVLAGASHANEALLTGESRAVGKTVGSSVIGGSINLDSPLTVRVRQLGQDTQLAGIVRLLDRALQEKPRLAQLADRVAGGFVAALLLVAAATYLYWQGHDPQHALWITVAVLVVSCPCALSLATPSALTTATGALARSGLLVTRGHALETLASADIVVFDKTGTLTRGEPMLSAQLSWRLDDSAALQLAASLEAASEHPLARAIADAHHGALLPASDFSNHPGGGVSACIDGQRYWLGAPQFVSQHCQQALPADLEPWSGGATVIVLANAQQALAAFALADQLRPDAAVTVAALQAAGLEPHLLSGDQPRLVADVAGELGIAHYQGGALPADKLAYIKVLQAQGKRVVMVGDGVNDAPVLAGADVSVAIGGGAEVAQAAADMVLLSGQLRSLASGVLHARRCRRVIRQNLLWALFYNLLAIPVAVAGLVTPWLASLGMALSSLLVVGNALRLGRVTPLEPKHG